MVNPTILESFQPENRVTVELIQHFFIKRTFKLNRLNSMFGKKIVLSCAQLEFRRLNAICLDEKGFAGCVRVAPANLEIENLCGFCARTRE